MHVHTTKGATDSALDPQDLAAEAIRRGLTAVNITEHDRLWDRFSLDNYRVQHSNLFINNGMEVSTDLGHMIVVGLPEYRTGIHQAKELRRVLDEVGGFMSVAHPFRHFFDPVYFQRQGKEPFTMSPEEAAERMAVFKLVDGIEVLNGANTARENLFALKVAKHLGKTMTAGSDAHSTQGIGIYALVFEKELTSERELLEELHAGRCVPHVGLLDGDPQPFTEDSFEGVSIPNT